MVKTQKMMLLSIDYVVFVYTIPHAVFSAECFV